MENKIIKAIENETLYDLIANEYYKMTKEQLKNIALELLWSIRIDEIAKNEAMENIKELLEMYQ